MAGSVRPGGNDAVDTADVVAIGDFGCVGCEITDNAPRGKRIEMIRTSYAESQTIGGSTPVPTVAMDCGLLESRLDRLGASNPAGSSMVA
jgi:hypothetical protein